LKNVQFLKSTRSVIAFLSVISTPPPTSTASSVLGCSVNASALGSKRPTPTPPCAYGPHDPPGIRRSVQPIPPSSSVSCARGLSPANASIAKY
jgi:hypothetical protein